VTVLIEWVAGVLRAGPEAHQHGDPFTFSATIIKRGDTVEVIGATGRIPPGGLRKFKELLATEGVTKIIWDRKRPQGDRHIETVTS
jgi:hypothetical protein